jgi:hypothetical protein
VTQFVAFTIGTGIAQRGQCYVQALTISNDATTLTHDCLACDYLFAGNTLQLDRYAPPGPAGGHGMMKAVDATDPAAGAEFPTIPVPTGAIWRVRAMDIAAALVTDATAGNRVLEIRMTDATPTRIGGGKSDPVPPSSTSPLLGGIGVNTGVVLAAGMAGGITLPDMFLFAAFQIQFTTKNLAAADNYGQGTLGIEEWVVPN